MGSIIATLDVLTGFAVAALNGSTLYKRPVMLSSESGEFNLVAARHPCLELQPNARFIPNDIRMKRR